MSSVLQQGEDKSVSADGLGIGCQTTAKLSCSLTGRQPP